MIKAYVGDFGSGKTLNMVWDLMNAMKRGVHVISNTPIEFYEKSLFGKIRHYKAEFIPNGKEFQKAIAYRQNCIFGIDEAAVYLPNIYWHKLPPEFIVKFAQTRKYRTDFWYTSQGFGMAVKRLRELTHRVLLCYGKRVLPLPYINFRIGKRKIKLFGWKRYITKIFRPEYFYGQPSFKKYERCYLGSRSLWPSQVRRVYKAYNTYYVIDASAMMGVKGFEQPTLKEQEEKIEIKVNTEYAISKDDTIPDLPEKPPITGSTEPRFIKIDGSALIN